ncbi:MAG TPA: nucleoside 2-deoxyribosyltransferase [Thermoanaerobaculia bacterium]|nr:nucleoside 2-deoxyribosyltransferase [Thermoanaerobaculia bacterium]
MATTIYFSGAISGGRTDVPLYRRIVDVLEQDGYRVLAGSVASEDVTDHGEDFDPCVVFTRDIGWIEQANVLVAEVSTPSTGVGYEIATARYRYHMPVICLYRPAYTKRCSAMVSGDMGIEVIEYDEAGFATMLERLREALARARE